MYCYKDKRKLDPKVVKVICHSQGSTALLSNTLNRMYFLGNFLLKQNSTGTANPHKWMQLGTSLISELECQSAGEKKNLTSHSPKISGFLRGDDSSSLQVICGERARSHIVSLLNTTEGDSVFAPTDEVKI